MKDLGINKIAATPVKYHWNSGDREDYNHLKGAYEKESKDYNSELSDYNKNLLLSSASNGKVIGRTAIANVLLSGGLLTGSLLKKGKVGKALEGAALASGLITPITALSLNAISNGRNRDSKLRLASSKGIVRMSKRSLDTAKGRLNRNISYMPEHGAYGKKGPGHVEDEMRRAIPGLKNNGKVSELIDGSSSISAFYDPKTKRVWSE